MKIDTNIYCNLAVLFALSHPHWHTLSSNLINHTNYRVKQFNQFLDFASISQKLLVDLTHKDTGT